MRRIEKFTLRIERLIGKRFKVEVRYRLFSKSYIKYDNKKLKFLGIEKVDGIRVIKMIKKEGELRVVLSKEDREKLINNKQLLLKLNFQGISSGYAFVDIVKGKVSDGIKMNHSLTDKECGWTYMIIN